MHLEIENNFPTLPGQLHVDLSMYLTREPDYKSLRLTQAPKAKESNRMNGLTCDNDLSPAYMNAT